MNKIQKKKKKQTGESQKVGWFERFKKFVKAQPKKEKPRRPKTYTVRRIGVFTFWALFAFMLLVVFITVTSSPESAETRNEKQAEVKRNPATKPAAIQFAKEFTRDYFKWQPTNDGWNDRSKRLTNYLAEGLDEQAGLVTESLEWNSAIQEIAYQKTDEITDKKSHIIFKVSSKMKKNKETKVVTKDFVVPVVHNGSTYGVYELPFVTHLKDGTDVEANRDFNQTNLASINDNGEVENIEAFLETFFNSFVQDSEDQLSYMLTDKTHQSGLNGALNFKGVNSTEVYEGNKAGQYFVISEVMFEEPVTKMQMNSVYKLVVEKKDDHYVVSRLNAEQKIKEKLSE
ncbi:conjugal transfer protein [Lentibacillus amyloliquefaciens]|uniref:Conjugal transfer protein n=1 Tax=Lentibacillus amyloliquefaciens TaxID=1472767 RepID=A0A0U4G4W3_9BACI|nr:conjugal transfer protein [Lentibacillus amyloliquefaciens]ALX47706.1 hypothetical protein AOX59_03260 [Lentibacillus amyloliquefaciens]